MDVTAEAAKRARNDDSKGQLRICDYGQLARSTQNAPHWRNQGFVQASPGLQDPRRDSCC